MIVEIFKVSDSCLRFNRLKKEGIKMELAEIRHQLADMNQKITSFRRSL